MWSPPWLIAFAAAALSACQNLSQPVPWSSQRSEPVPSWRVVERVGESRFLSPSMSGWEQVEARSILPAGSQISTGIGGRLILTQASNQLSAGTNSRFILPDPGPGGSLRQTAGWLRYRIADAPSGSFGIETPFLDLAVGDAVVDVTVAESETEVAVLSGRVHVKTQDGRRQIDLHAGYIGYAGLDGDPLALRRRPDLALESVPALVIPALHPARHAAAAPPDAAALQGAADPGAATAAAPEARGAATGSAPLPAMQPGAMTALSAMAGAGTPALVAPKPAPDPGLAVAAAMVRALPAPLAIPISIEGAGSDATLAAAPVVVPEPAEDAPETSPVRVAAVLPAAMPVDAPADQVRQRFDLLTEGLLDGLSPAPPATPGTRR
jgi:hypothetical protein